MTDLADRWTRRAALAGGGSFALGGAALAEDLPWRLPKLRQVKVRDHQMAFYEMGAGPPLVLVHGASGSPPLE